MGILPNTGAAYYFLLDHVRLQLHTVQLSNAILWKLKKEGYIGGYLGVKASSKGYENCHLV